MVTHNPTVSVIIPFHGTDESVLSAIMSVFYQTYSDIELIMINDDAETFISERVEDLLNTSRHIKSKYYKFSRNVGKSNARNKGIQLASGYYVAFLDADDVWKKNKLEMQVNFLATLNDEKSVLCFTGLESIHWISKKLTVHFYCKNKCFSADLAYANPIPFSSALIKRDAIGDVVFRGDRKEDFRFWREIFSKDSEISAVQIREPLLFYRQPLGFNFLRKKINRAFHHIKFLTGSDPSLFGYLKLHYDFLRYLLHSFKRYR